QGLLAAGGRQSGRVGGRGRDDALPRPRRVAARPVPQPGRGRAAAVTAHEAGGGDPPGDRRRSLDDRGRARPVHQREDGEEPPCVDLREAGRPGPHAGRPQRRPHGHRPAPVAVTERGRAAGSAAPGPDGLYPLLPAKMGRLPYSGDHGACSYCVHAVTTTDRHHPSAGRGSTSMNLFILKTWLESKFAKDERGANLVEYILLVAFIALVVIAGVKLLGNQVNNKFSNASTNLN